MKWRRRTPRSAPAAWTELAKLYLRADDLAKADVYAQRALAGQAMDSQTYSEAYQLFLVIRRLKGDPKWQPARNVSTWADPLAHVGRFERYLLNRDEDSRKAFVDGIRNEMPHETFLELAAWYHGLGRLDEARQLLELAPPQAEVLYWLAYVQWQIESKLELLTATPELLRAKLELCPTQRWTGVWRKAPALRFCRRPNPPLLGWSSRSARRARRSSSGRCAPCRAVGVRSTTWR